MANFCPTCGVELQENETCAACAAQPAQPVAPITPGQTAAGANSKLYSILSYIGILWLVGMLVAPEKDDPGVRFHVGQGIVLTIVLGAANIVNAIFMGILHGIFGVRETIPFLGTVRMPSPFVGTLSTIVYLAIWGLGIFLVVKGIMNANEGKQEPLPIIGQFSFYK